jgi:hypothetical protein
MKYEKNYDLIQKTKVENNYHILTWFEIMIIFQNKM